MKNPSFRQKILKKAHWHFARYITHNKLSKYKKQLRLAYSRQPKFIEKYTLTVFMYFNHHAEWVGQIIFNGEGYCVGISIPENVRSRIRHLEKK